MKQLRIHLLLPLSILLGCKGQQFEGIQQYESIAVHNAKSLNRALDIIQAYSKNVDSTYVFGCVPEEPSILNEELCQILQQCRIKEAVRYKSGNVHFVFDRLRSGQSYGTFLTVEKPFNVVEKEAIQDTATDKYYIKRIPNSNFYLNGETD